MFSQTLLDKVLPLLLVAAHVKGDTLPAKFGYILYSGFAVLDVFGRLEVLGELSFTTNLNLTLITETLEPVPSCKISWWPSSVNSTFSESVVPTHAFETATPLDVLVISGGIGSRVPSPLPIPQSTRAGVLDDKHAATHKRAWAETTARGPKVEWVAQARWVTNGNIWTSSRVAAGTDAMIAFIETIYGNTSATTVADGMEYERHLNSTDGPFATLCNLTDANNSTNPL